MEQLRKAFATISAQLARLSVSQRLLIASLLVLMLMAFFLVSQYAGSPKLVDLIPTGTAEDQQRVTSSLDAAGIVFQMRNGKVAVAAEEKYPALAALARAQALPTDKRLMFSDLASQNSLFRSNKEIDQMTNFALGNELAQVIRHFPGINDASVMVSNPAPSGLGTIYRKPTAQVTVFPDAGRELDQHSVNALADLVAGSTAGLQARDIAIIDGTNKRSYRATGPDDFSGNYLDQVAKVERRVKDKILEHLQPFIQDVIVSVNAMVDADQKETQETRVLPKNDGTVSVTSEETSDTSTTKDGAAKGAEPGVQPNVAMNINQGSSSGTGAMSSDERSTTKSETRFGERVQKTLSARGRPTKINVTVSVPRDYVAEILKERKESAGAAAGGGAAGGKAAEPTDAEIQQEWNAPDGVKARIEDMIAPMVETDGPTGAQLTAGTVRAFLIPVPMGTPGGGGGSAHASAGGGISAIGKSLGLGGNLVKNVVLGLLAVLSIGLMLMMTRKAAKASPLPTAEELVGIPPALEAGSDVVGEADETDSPMVAIEVDADQLKSSKMLEEIGALVKSNPNSAATVFNRWLSTES